jgi:hypothetical protein
MKIETRFLEQWLQASKRRGLGRRTVVLVIHDDECCCGLLGMDCECDDPVFIFRFVDREPEERTSP